MSNRHALLVASFALLGACAQQQAPIDRVQPNYFDKSFFVGKDFLDASDDPEFYSQGTLVDVGYGAGQDGLFTSTYAQPLTRVKFTVQEDMLLARLSYERISNSDGKGTGKATNDGIVVAAYKITSHFDIKRQYNPSTGEQVNVIEENTVDRPWYQRQYMRVDWSKNLSTDNYDYDTLSQMGIFGAIEYEPLSYYINDPKNADAPHFDAAGGYLDITNKAFAKPGMVDLSAWGGGMLPACYFDADFSGGGAPATACTPIELTIRQSFKQVKDNDYEPADWDGFRFSAFGAFTTDRLGYARNYGMTDTQLHRFINRYNLWERSHFYKDPAAMTGEVSCYTPATTPAGADPHRDLNGDGTDDECASVGKGSRCDIFRQRCTLPFADRVAKPIAWHFAEGSNLEFFEPTKRATLEWDVALRSAVVTARYAECKQLKGTDCATRFPAYFGQQDDNQDAIDLVTEVESCRDGLAYAGQDCNTVATQVGAARGYTPGVIALAQQTPMIVLCHSPVEAKDPSLCGDARLPAGLTSEQCAAARQADDTQAIAVCEKATTARKGDLRYHQINAIVTPQTPSPWGIMVDSNDPLTGEVVAASINVWTHVTSMWSQSVVDMSRYIKGELTTADVTDGTYVRDWASAAEAASHMSTLPKLTEGQRIEMLAQLTGAKSASALSRSKASLANSDIMLKARKFQHSLADIKADALAPSTTAPIYEARRKHALNTATEAALTTQMMQSYAGGAGKLDSTTLTEFASPLRGANPSLQHKLHQLHENALGARGACVMNEAPAPLGIANLADVLQEKFGNFDPTQSKDVQLARAEKMRLYLAQRTHYAVITHEMGHSIGLRHNFVSSSDAFNYRPQYWQLRTNDGAQTNDCVTAPSANGCTGPRYLDPVSDPERQNLISMFMQSTTMDYAGETTQDMLGLGAYDFAAAKMFYGDVVPVFKDPEFVAGQKLATGALNKVDNFGGILGFQYEVGDPMTGDPTNTRTIHYSQLQKEFGMISDCAAVDTNKFKPAAWNEALMGKWSPLLDGLIVNVNGATTRCRQHQVDYVQWNSMSDSAAQTASHAIDATGRVRFPYGFATDRWADIGNLSVYRHDNGADPYELFDFLITQQEVNHIFDNYRRNRQTFSVRNASNRTLERYSEKLRDAAKGLGLMANIYRDFSQAQGYDYNGLWPSIASDFFADNLLASGLGFDHFAKQLARPEAGPHQMSSQGTDRVLRSTLDSAGNAGASVMNVPNGATGYYGNVAPGGRPIENALASNQGEYDAEFTINCGSYYDKAWTSMLMTESVDNFISDSRRDFLDGRYRAVSVADVFPEGYRRWLGNNLTGDDVIKGVRVASNASNGKPIVDSNKFPTSGLGWTSWWGDTVKSCFAKADSLECDVNPASTTPIEAQVGWEQQKFLIAWTLQYLPENAQQSWLNQMNIWELGADTDPGFTNRIQLKLPDGKVYVAKTQGKETIFGKLVQKGIGARMLEWGNNLLLQAYVTTDGPDLDADGHPDWYEPTYVNGSPVIRYDPSVKWVDTSGNLVTGRPGCNSTDNSSCTCSSNKACLELSKYAELPFFMRQAMRDYGLADPSMKGLY